MTLCLSFEKTFVRSTLSVYLFVMCFISQKKNTKCFVLTLRDISERTSVISFRNKREIHIASHRIACIKRKKKKKTEMNDGLRMMGTMMWIEQSENRKNMTYLRIEHKRPREFIQNQQGLCRARWKLPDRRKQL